MFRIRRIFDDHLPVNREAIEQVQDILRRQFNGLAAEDVEKLPHQLRNPLKHSLRSILFVAEGKLGDIKGFAFLHHAPDLHFCYLDYISAAAKRTGGGIGSALYEKVRDVSILTGSLGLFFECLPDDLKLCEDPKTQKQNAARLRFYERYGAFPVINTLYETPLNENDDCAPLLVFDDLGTKKLPDRATMKAIVKAILKRKYGHLCPPSYIKMVVDSIKDDPIQIRSPRYIKDQPVKNKTSIEPEFKIALLVNDKHDIHHIHERGYVESPIRIDTILKELRTTTLFEEIKPKAFSENNIYKVHNRAYVNYFKRICQNLLAGKSMYPYVFPIRNAARPPKELSVRAGYYCIDTFTPLNKNAYLAAKRAVDCALTAAECLLKGYNLAYALVRPPGHHAEHNAFGGFCYFNSNAIAANHLTRYGSVAILDLDYHHGNGQQNIFYNRNDVLTVSIHGHPSFAYPYFSGFAEEKGEEDGFGYNINYPLPEDINGEKYSQTLAKAIRRISKFSADFLVIALGLDPAKGDPTGTWNLTFEDFEKNGYIVGNLGLPTLVVQEGGYKVKSIGINAKRFLTGLYKGFEDHFNK